MLGAGSYFLSHRLPTAEAATTCGYQVQVMAIDDGVAQDITDLGYLFHRRRWQHDTSPVLSTTLAIFQLMFLIFRTSPKIVHCISLKSAPIGLIAALFFWRIRFIFSINGLGYFFSRKDLALFQSLMRMGIMFLFRHISKRRRFEVIFQNEDDKQIFKNNNIQNQTLFHLVRGSGVDVKKYVSDVYPFGPIVFGIGCRMLKIKGVDELIRAGLQLQEKNIPIKLLLAGSVDPGNPASLSVSYIKSCCRDGYIEWRGYVEDIKAFWEQCHVAVLPSHGGEGVPKSLLVAASMQRALIASDTNGNRDLIVEGVNGFLCEPRSVSSLEQAMLNCLSTDIRAFGAASRRHILTQKMDNESVTKAMIDIYKI